MPNNRALYRASFFIFLLMALDFFTFGVSFREAVAGQEATVSSRGGTAVAQEIPSQEAPESSGSASAQGGGVGSAVQLAQEEVRDPFQSQLKSKTEVEEVAPKTEQSTKVTLQGVGFGSKDAYAIINDDIYYPTEEKNGIKLLAVRKREADVLVNGAMQTLQLVDKESVRKSTEGRRKTEMFPES